MVDGVECSQQVQEHNCRSLTTRHSKVDIVLNCKKSCLSEVSGPIYGLHSVAKTVLLHMVIELFSDNTLHKLWSKNFDVTVVRQLHYQM